MPRLNRQLKLLNSKFPLITVVTVHETLKLPLSALIHHFISSKLFAYNFLFRFPFPNTHHFNFSFHFLLQCSSAKWPLLPSLSAADSPSPQLQSDPTSPSSSPPSSTSSLSLEHPWPPVSITLRLY